MEYGSESGGCVEYGSERGVKYGSESGGVWNMALRVEGVWNMALRVEVCGIWL